MDRFFALFSTLLFFSFVACCVASALLQVVAWTRHAKEGVNVDLRALWRPDGLFDNVGLFQMRLAKRALLIGAVMYLSYGVMMLLAGTVMQR